MTTTKLVFVSKWTKILTFGNPLHHTVTIIFTFEFRFLANLHVLVVREHKKHVFTKYMAVSLSGILKVYEIKNVGISQTFRHVCKSHFKLTNGNYLRNFRDKYWKLGNQFHLHLLLSFIKSPILIEANESKRWNICALSVVKH